MDIKEAVSIAGKLGTPSKMPGYSYGLPAGKDCPVGSKLMDIEGSTCYKCYAVRGFYQYPNVQNAQQKRLLAIAHPNWVEAMVELLYHYVDPNDPYFRWHDSGDLQNMEHLLKIVEIARQTKYVRHWLPTREVALVAKYFKQYGVLHPTNLTIRVSATMIDGKPSKVFPLTSTVVFDKQVATCPARLQGNKCGDCRACWDKRIKNIAYPKH